MKKLFIGKLSFSTTESGLRELFSEFEPLSSVKIINDKMTGRSRGFGFIEIDDSDRAEEAIKALNGATLDGYAIAVNEARPQSESSRGSTGYRFSKGDSGRSRGGDYRSSNSRRY